MNQEEAQSRLAATWMASWPQPDDALTPLPEALRARGWCSVHEAALPTPAELPALPAPPTVLTFTVDAAMFRTVCAAASAATMHTHGRIKTFRYDGRIFSTWSVSPTIAHASVVVPRTAWTGPVSSAQHHGMVFSTGKRVTAGRQGEMVIAHEQAVFQLQPTAPTPDPVTPSPLAPGQRWTLDIAFQSFDDGTIEALRALDMARPRVDMSLDAPALTIAGRTVTGDHCTCDEKAYGILCRHVRAIHLLRHYHDDTPQAVCAAPTS